MVLLFDFGEVVQHDESSDFECLEGFAEYNVVDEAEEFVVFEIFDGLLEESWFFDGLPIVK